MRRPCCKNLEIVTIMTGEFRFSYLISILDLRGELLSFCSSIVGFHPNAKMSDCEWWQDVWQQLFWGEGADYTVWTGLCPAVLPFAVTLCLAVLSFDIDCAFSILHVVSQSFFSPILLQRLNDAFVKLWLFRKIKTGLKGLIEDCSVMFSHS